MRFPLFQPATLALTAQDDWIQAHLSPSRVYTHEKGTKEDLSQRDNELVVASLQGQDVRYFILEGAAPESKEAFDQWLQQTLIDFLPGGTSADRFITRCIVLVQTQTMMRCLLAITRRECVIVLKNRFPGLVKVAAEIGQCAFVFSRLLRNEPIENAGQLGIKKHNTDLYPSNLKAGSGAGYDLLYFGEQIVLLRSDQLGLQSIQILGEDALTWSEELVSIYENDERESHTLLVANNPNASIPFEQLEMCGVSVHRMNADDERTMQFEPANLLLANGESGLGVLNFLSDEASTAAVHAYEKNEALRLMLWAGGVIATVLLGLLLVAGMLQNKLVMADDELASFQSELVNIKLKKERISLLTKQISQTSELLKTRTQMGGYLTQIAHSTPGDLWIDSFQANGNSLPFSIHLKGATYSEQKLAMFLNSLKSEDVQAQLIVSERVMASRHYRQKIVSDDAIVLFEILLTWPHTS